MLADLVARGIVRERVDLAPLTTYKVGGPARWLLEASGLDDLLSVCPYSGPVLVIGRGSNLVVADEGFGGLVIRLGSEFADIRIDDYDLLAGGNVPLPAVARAAARAGVAGLSWMVGVPGSVGGAVRMNAGCFGSDTAAILTVAAVLDVRTGKLDVRPADQLGFHYRSSNLSAHEIVVDAAFAGTPGDPGTLDQEMLEVTRWRREHQPGGTHNAGSVFKNPEGDAAGRIIDDLGLKGTRVGAVSVSDKHANFFVADKGAKAREVYDLVRLVQSRVLEATGVELVPEMVFAGFEYE